MEGRVRFKNEVRALHGTVKKAEHAEPDRFREHESILKELARVQLVRRRERKVELREDYFDRMPGVEIDDQIDQLLGEGPDADSQNEGAEEWNLLCQYIPL